MRYSKKEFSRKGYRRMKREFSSRLYEGKVSLIECIRYWFIVRRLIRGALDA